jgi:hypothetical protein
MKIGTASMRWLLIFRECGTIRVLLLEIASGCYGFLSKTPCMHVAAEAHILLRMGAMRGWNSSAG